MADVQGDTFRPGQLKTCSSSEQYKRQRGSDTWEPAGFQRFQYQRALVHEMPILGGPNDQYGANPDRYRPIGREKE